MIEQNLHYANTHFNAEGDGMYAGGSVDNFYGADAAQSGRKQLTQPIIIIAENTGSSEETDIELFEVDSKSTTAPILAGTGSKVVLTSGVKNSTLTKLYASLRGATVFDCGSIRIECTKANNDNDLNSAAGVSLDYKLTTIQGDFSGKSIYCDVSIIQQVKNVRDVTTDGVVINSDASLMISRIPAGARIEYKMYPRQLGTSTSTMIRSNSAKEFAPIALNAISGQNF